MCINSRRFKVLDEGYSLRLLVAVELAIACFPALDHRRLNFRSDPCRDFGVYRRHRDHDHCPCRGVHRGSCVHARGVVVLPADSAVLGTAFDSWVWVQGEALSDDPIDPSPVVAWPSPHPNALPSEALH
jgi:hypothetical protein